LAVLGSKLRQVTPVLRLGTPEALVERAGAAEAQPLVRRKR
jgi:hypothetical protein